jgi:RNA polymerase-binding transcription factor DksA
VAALLQAAGFTGDEHVTIPKDTAPISLRQALSTRLALNGPTYKFAQLLHDRATDEADKARLAAAITPDPAGQGLEVGVAFTGRVNLNANGPGIVEVDVDADEGDPDLAEREKNLALLTVMERKLESVNMALRAIDKGRYGICERCGNPIDPARLEVRPDATLCLDCQREVERIAKKAALRYMEE